MASAHPWSARHAAAAGLVPGSSALTLALQWGAGAGGPLGRSTALLGVIGLPPALRLIQLLGDHHGQPGAHSGSKFLALEVPGLQRAGPGLVAWLVGPAGAVNPAWFPSAAWKRNQRLKAAVAAVPAFSAPAPDHRRMEAHTHSVAWLLRL